MFFHLLVRFYVLRHNTDLIKDSLRSILAIRHQLTQMYWPGPVETTQQCGSVKYSSLGHFVCICVCEREMVWHWMGCVSVLCG